MKKSYFLLISVLPLAIFAQSLYQTGFEAEGEPFGNWKAGNTVTRGGATTMKAYSGKNSMSPGYGNGRYGTGKNFVFDPVLKADRLWISYRQQSGRHRLRGKLLTAHRVGYVNCTTAA